MKTIFNRTIARPLSISLITTLLLTLSFTSCKKKEVTPVVASALAVYNVAASSSPQDFYLDDLKINTTPLSYTQGTDYVTVVGDHQATFKTSSTGTANNSFYATFQEGVYYTLYYTDDTSVVVTEDNRTAPTTGTAKVRFLNMSAVSVNVDFTDGNGAVLEAALAIKTPSVYHTVTPTTTYQLHYASSSTVLLNIPATIPAGKIATILITGASQGTIAYQVRIENQ